MILIPIVLVLVVVVVAAAGGLGSLASQRAHERTGGVLGGGLAMMVVLGLGVVVVLVAFAAVLSVGRSDDPGSSPVAEPPPTSSTADEPSPTTTPARKVPAPSERRNGALPGLGPRVVLTERSLEHETDRFPRSYEALDELSPTTVLDVRARGFEPFAAALARQCVALEGLRCGNVIEVQFDAQGEASFQYLVSDQFLGPGEGPGCRATTSPCSLVIESSDGSSRAERQTVFEDALAPAGRIRVEPRTELKERQRVTVTVEHYPPGVRVQAMLCAPPDAAGSERCGEPGPTAPMLIGPDGTGSATLTVQSGPVGLTRAPCGHGHVCGISVASDAVFARAPVVSVTFAPIPGAGYDPARLGVGLGVAALLLGAAAFLIRRTDWSPVGEEAAPEIDEAEYADLDALVAAMPPAEDLDDLIGRIS